MEYLLETILHSVSLSREDQAKVLNSFVKIKLDKGSSWIVQGKVCQHIAFVNHGKLRVYYLDSDGNETTCFFVTPRMFISSFTSFLTGAPSNENIAALEDCELFTIFKPKLETLSEEIPKIHIWRRMMAENLFIMMEKRISMLQSTSAHERYEQMIQENQEIILNVPLQYTASFLGITPQHLSRLRKEMQK